MLGSVGQEGENVTLVLTPVYIREIVVTLFARTIQTLRV